MQLTEFTHAWLLQVWASASLPFSPQEKENQKVFLLQPCLEDLQQHNLIYYLSLLHKHFLLCQTNHLLYHFSLRSQHHLSPVVTYPVPALGLCTAWGPWAIAVFHFITLPLPLDLLGAANMLLRVQWGTYFISLPYPHPLNAGDVNLPVLWEPHTSFFP